ncbi:hypothetical protein IC582_028764 [Cucumis melo]
MSTKGQTLVELSSSIVDLHYFLYVYNHLLYCILERLNVERER